MDNQGFLPVPKSFSTRAIHSGQDPEKWDSMAVVPPLVLSTVFKQLTPSTFKEYEYSRMDNPSRRTLETCLASLEKAKYAICLSSGIAAASTMLNLLKPGDHVICGDGIYRGNYHLFNDHLSKFNIEFSFVKITEVSEYEAAIKENTKMIWLDTPSNPCLTVTDIRALSKVAKAHDIILAIDNTFLTPYLQRPLELGADVSVYSLTKYMNGHSDAIMGAIVTNRDDLHERLRHLQTYLGSVPAPFDCSMVTRGLKTLVVRLRQHSASGLAIAKYLESHRNIEKVVHPGLPSHPQHEVFKSQTSGHSGMLAVYVKGAYAETEKFLLRLKLFTMAGSLGGAESVLELTGIKGRKQLSDEHRQRIGVTDNLVRISVGLEDADDLIADLEQALNF